MNKFAIVIPFRPKIQSANWEKDCDLLKNSVLSLINQTYKNICIYIVSTEAVDLHLNDTRINYILFPYGYLSLEAILNRVDLFRRFKSESLVVRRWDKARKLTYGSKIAIENGAEYVMAMDADDRLSKYFFEKLSVNNNNTLIPGWYMQSGYLYRLNSSFMTRMPSHFNSFNGSTYVIHKKFIKIPEFNSIEWVDYNLFTDHGWLKDRIKDEYGEELSVVTSPSLVYVVHDSNISNVKKEYNYSIKKIIKRLLYSVKITRELKDEFNLL